MFKCPFCQATARTRTSRILSENTVRQYHQCQNLLCSRTFTTLNSVEREIKKKSILSDNFIPDDAFPKSHYPPVV